MSDPETFEDIGVVPDPDTTDDDLDVDEIEKRAEEAAKKAAEEAAKEEAEKAAIDSLFDGPGEAQEIKTPEDLHKWSDKQITSASLSALVAAIIAILPDEKFVSINLLTGVFSYAKNGAATNPDGSVAKKPDGSVVMTTQRIDLFKTAVSNVIS